jgi:hypothetical protein
VVTLLPATLRCCRWELERRRMIPPSNIALRMVVEEDPRLVRRLNTNYGEAEADGGLDVAERDALFDAVGRHFVGEPWPRSGGVDATRQFIVKLQREMKKTGWVVDFFALTL